MRFTGFFNSSIRLTDKAFARESFGTARRTTPLAPEGLPVFSRISRNGLMTSIGIGKMIVEFCSARDSRDDEYRERT